MARPHRGAVVTELGATYGFSGRQVAFEAPTGTRLEQFSERKPGDYQMTRVPPEVIQSGYKRRRDSLAVEYIVVRAWRGTALLICPFLLLPFALLALVNRPLVTVLGALLVIISILSVLWADLGLVTTAPGNFLRMPTFANLLVCSIAGAVQTSTISLMLPSGLFPGGFGDIGRLSVALVFGVTAGMFRSLISSSWNYAFVIDRLPEPQMSPPSIRTRIRREVIENSHMWSRFLAESWFILAMCALLDVSAAKESLKAVLFGMFGVGLVAVGMTLISWRASLSLATLLLTRHVDFTRDNEPHDTSRMHDRLIGCLGKLEEYNKGKRSRSETISAEDNTTQQSLIRLLALDDLRRVAIFNIGKRRLSIFEDPSGDTLRKLVEACVFELKQLSSLLPSDQSLPGYGESTVRVDIEGLGRRAIQFADERHAGTSSLPDYHAAPLLGGVEGPVRQSGVVAFGAVATEVVRVPPALRQRRRAESVRGGGHSSDLGLGPPIQDHAEPSNTVWNRMNAALMETEVAKLITGSHHSSATLAAASFRALMALEILQAFAIATPNEDQYGTARRIYADVGLDVLQLQPNEPTSLSTALYQLANRNIMYK